MVLENKSMANMTRCLLDRAEKNNLSRFLPEANWDAGVLNRARIAYLLEQTKRQRRGVHKSVLAIDDTLCEHVGKWV